MSGRVIAQIIINGTAFLSKAFVSAYQQALRNAKHGGAPVQQAVRTKFKMQPDEALKILDIQKENLTKEILEEKFKKLFAANDPAKGGSFYLQSKVYRSKEVLDNELKEKGGGTNKDPNDTNTPKSS